MNFCRFYNKIQIKINGMVGNEYEKKKSVNIFIGIIGLVFLIPTLVLLLMFKAIFTFFSKLWSYIPKPDLEKPIIPDINQEELIAGIVVIAFGWFIIYMANLTAPFKLAIGISILIIWMFGTLGIACVLDAVGIKKQSNWMMTWFLEKPLTFLWNKTTSQCDLVKKEDVDNE